jgi:hypothetical protein
MSIGTIHIGSAVLNFVGTGAFSLVGAENVSIDPGIKSEMKFASGQTDPSFLATMAASPVITATILDCGTAITNGITFDPPLAITTGGAGLTSVDAVSVKATLAGTRASGANHFKSTMLNAMVEPKSIKATQGNAASMDIAIHGYYDGTNNPLAWTDSVSLSSTPALAQLYTVGKVVVNGTEVAGVTGITFDFGWEVKKEAATGQVFDSFVYVSARNPKITITTKEFASISTFGLTGTAQGSSATAVYFQAMAQDGTRIAAGTASHIKISMSASQGMIYPQAFGGSNNESAEGVLVIQPVAGTSAIITVNGASAIT